MKLLLISTVLVFTVFAFANSEPDAQDTGELAKDESQNLADVSSVIDDTINNRAKRSPLPDPLAASRRAASRRAASRRAASRRAASRRAASRRAAARRLFG